MLTDCRNIPDREICETINSSAVHCLIVLIFDAQVHYPWAL